jgi:hypothetical protein
MQLYGSFNALILSYFKKNIQLMQGIVHKLFFIYYITNINKKYELVVLHLPKENNGKVEEYQFKLVEGQYTTVEAQKNSIRAYKQ